MHPLDVLADLYSIIILNNIRVNIYNAMFKQYILSIVIIDLGDFDSISYHTEKVQCT